MTVLFITQHWPPDIGGAQKYVYNLVRHCADISCIVVVPKELNVKVPYLSFPNVRVVPVRFSWPPIWPSWLPLYVIVKRIVIREHVSWVVCGKALFEGLLACRLKRRLGIQFVVCTYAMEIGHWAARRKTRRRLKHVIESADIVAYMNNRTKKTLEAFGVAASQLTCIQPGVEGRFFQKMPHVEKYASKPYILSVGRLIQRKGFDDLIKAFSFIDRVRYGNLSLVIVGDGPEKLNLQNLIRSLNAHVTLVSDVSDDDLPALYHNADFFALTPKDIGTDYEGFGIVYLEAAASGRAAIATDCGGTSEAVVHNKTGIVVEANNISAIQRAIESLLEDPSMAKSLGDEGQRRAKKFMWNIQAEKLIAVMR